MKTLITFLLLGALAHAENFGPNNRGPNPFLNSPTRRFARPPPNLIGQHPNSEPFIPGATPYSLTQIESGTKLPLNPRPNYNNFEFSPGEEDRTPVSDVAFDGKGLVALQPGPPPPGLLEENLEDESFTSPDVPLQEEERESSFFEIPEPQEGQLSVHEGRAEENNVSPDDVNYYTGEEYPEGEEEDNVQEEEPENKSHKREAVDAPDGRIRPSDFYTLQSFDMEEHREEGVDSQSLDPESRSHLLLNHQIPENDQENFRTQQTFGNPPNQEPEPFKNFENAEEREQRPSFSFQDRPRPNQRPRIRQQASQQQFREQFPPPQRHTFPQPQRFDSEPPKFVQEFNERGNALHNFNSLPDRPQRPLGGQKHRPQGGKIRRKPFNQFADHGSDTHEGVNQLIDELYPNEGDYAEEEKPDRLSILLQKTKFNCQHKKDGYYADEELGCEVFHFCQDKVKHSWLCPNGASFHQVHLICMPQSEDNICEKSSKFHFVNDYLYKETRESTGRNKSYVQRYYPKGYEGGIASLEERQAIQIPSEQEYESEFAGQVATNHQQNRPPVRGYNPRNDYEEEPQDEYYDDYPQQPQEPHREVQNPNFSAFSNRHYSQPQASNQEVELRPKPGASFLLNDEEPSTLRRLPVFRQRERQQ